MTETLAKWGDTAKQHVRLTDTSVVLHIDEDEIAIPIADATERKALWADAQWIVARLLETGAETISKNYDRTKDLILAGERLAALCRGASACDGHVARSTSLAFCLDLYDLARRRARAPSAYDLLRDPKALEGEPVPAEPPPTPPAKFHDSPSLPEPETEALYQVLFHWRERLKAVEADLEQVKNATLPDTDPNAPCPDDLARAYTRLFKAKTVVHYLEGAVHEQLGEHIATVTSEGDFPTEMRFRIQTAILTSPPDPGTGNAPAPADPAPTP